MAEGAPRRQLHGYVSREARDGWYGFAKEYDTNVTALLEAVGLELLSHRSQSPRQLPQVLRQIVSEAQKIAGRRSTRRHAD